MQKQKTCLRMQGVSTLAGIIIIVAAAAAILFGGVFAWQYYLEKNKNYSNQTCNDIVQQIDSLVFDANHCAEDSDCIDITPSVKTCGYFLVNKNADLTKVKEENKKLADSKCVILCEPSPPLSKNDIKCRNNKCAVDRTK